MTETLYIYFIAFSSLIGWLFFNRNKDKTYLKWFPFFLVLSVVVETYGNYMSSLNIDNTRLYNFFSHAEFIFYFFVLYHIIRSRRVKKAIFIIACIFVPLDLLNIFFGQGLDVFHAVTYSVGCVLIIAPSIYYFYELFRLPKLISLMREPSFWIVSGLLFFYSCSFPYFAFTGLLNDAAPFIMNNFSMIISILNILLYSLFSIAFICRIRVRKSILL